MWPCTVCYKRFIEIPDEQKIECYIWTWFMMLVVSDVCEGYSGWDYDLTIALVCALDLK